jgi:hypothetical protein
MMNEHYFESSAQLLQGSESLSCCAACVTCRIQAASISVEHSITHKRMPDVMAFTNNLLSNCSDRTLRTLSISFCFQIIQAVLYPSTLPHEGCLKAPLYCAYCSVSAISRLLNQDLQPRLLAQQTARSALTCPWSPPSHPPHQCRPTRQSPAAQSHPSAISGVVPGCAALSLLLTRKIGARPSAPQQDAR